MVSHTVPPSSGVFLMVQLESHSPLGILELYLEFRKLTGGSRERVPSGWVLGVFRRKAFLMNWTWDMVVGGGGEKGEVKGEASAQANARMALTGKKKTVGGAVLGRRCAGCQFPCHVGSSCPRDHGGSKAWAPDGSLPVQSPWHSWSCFKKDPSKFSVFPAPKVPSL